MTNYRFDPEFVPILKAMPPSAADYSTVEGVQARRAEAPALAAPVPQREDVSREDRSIPGLNGAPDVPVRIYRPKSGTAGPRGCVYEIHGGGFMFGSLDMMDAWCDNVAGDLDAVVISVDYRLAPEHPYPAGIEDCYAGLTWAAANSANLGIDPTRIAIAGQSAGGGLAAGTALMARDKGGPALCFQLLEIPELDDRLVTPSMVEFTDSPIWNRPNAIWSWRHYLGDLLGGDIPIYAAPSRATDLAHLPPAYVSTMEFDPLRDEGLDYAVRMLQAGVSVEVHSFPGTFHGSSMIPAAEVTTRNAAEVMGALKRAISG